MATPKKKGNDALAAGLGAAAIAAAAAGAGYYFYGSTHAKKHRAAASTWARGLKRDVLKRAKALKKIDAKSIAAAVDDAVEMYEHVRGVSAADLKSATKELKANWKAIQGEVTPTKRTAATKSPKKKTTSTRKRRV